MVIFRCKKTKNKKKGTQNFPSVTYLSKYYSNLFSVTKDFSLYIKWKSVQKWHCNIRTPKHTCVCNHRRQTIEIRRLREMVVHGRRGWGSLLWRLKVPFLNIHGEIDYYLLFVVVYFSFVIFKRKDTKSLQRPPRHLSRIRPLSL